MRTTIFIEFLLSMAYILYAYILFLSINDIKNIRNDVIRKKRIAIIIVHLYVLSVSIAILTSSCFLAIVTVGGYIVALANQYLSQKW